MPLGTLKEGRGSRPRGRGLAWQAGGPGSVSSMVDGVDAVPNNCLLTILGKH